MRKARPRSLQISLSLGIIAALALSALLWLAAAGEKERLAAAEARFVGRAVVQGSQVYAAACAGCHGVAGGGIPDVAPPLNSSQWFTDRLAELNYQGSLRDFIQAAVVAGRPAGNEKYSSVMPAWDSAFGGPLRADEISAVTSFVLNWQMPPTPDESLAASTPPTGGFVAQGKALYGSLDCLGCHGWPGRGGITGPDLAGIAARGGQQMPGMDAEGYIRVSILAPSAFIAAHCPTGPCPDMMPRDYSARLSPREIELVLRYLLTLTETPGGQRPPGAPPPLVGGLTTPTPSAAPPMTTLERGQALYTDHCAMCHGERGQGGLGTGLGAVLVSVDPVAYTRAATAQGVPGLMPGWSQSVGGPLTDADLDAVSAYVVDLVQR